MRGHPESRMEDIEEVGILAGGAPYVFSNSTCSHLWGCPILRFFPAKGGRAQTSTRHRFCNLSVRIDPRLNHFPKTELARDQRFESFPHPCSPIPLQRVN